MDKVILKIAGIFALIMGVIYSITIIGLIVGVPLIIGGIKFMNYSNMTDAKLTSEKSNLLGWSIFLLIFTFISGLLGLIYYFSLTETYDNITDSIKFKNRNLSYLEELEKLKELYDKEILTKEEYEAKKKQVLDL